MKRPDSFREPFTLHDWLVRPDLNRIRGADGDVQIEPRVMAVLVALADQPGAVVTRLDLLDTVWGDTVVGEEILTRAVSELRRVFGDDARRPAYIETIRNHGYRLIAPVGPVVAEPVEPERGSADRGGPGPVPPSADPAPAPPPADPPPPTPSAPPEAAPVSPDTDPGHRAAGGRGGSWLRLAVVAALLAAVAVYVPRVVRPGSGTDPGPQLLSPVPLTSYPGREYHPAIAPDGTRIAFAWSGPDEPGSAIHVRQRNAETRLRLADEPGWAAWPAWSPDGQSVAFVQTADTVSAICVVPGLGGPVRRVLRVRHLVEGLDWSPDGRTLAYGALDDATGDYAIFLLDLETLAVTPFAASRPDDAGDRQPRFSPDGGRLAWIGSDRTGGHGLFVADVSGGGFRTLVLGLDQLQGVAWRSDGEALVYAAAPAGAFSLWEVPAGGGEPVPLRTPGEFAWNPTIARGSGDLVYEQVIVDQDLWQVRVLDRATWETLTVPFAPSTRWEFAADYHPDGRTVAFVSARDGQPEAWLAGTNGEDPRRVTTLGATAITNLRWAPDGGLLACNAVVEGESRILVLDPAGGAPRRLATGWSREVFGAWTPAGDALLAGADGPSGWQVYRLPLSGGEPVRLTRADGVVGQESGDGRSLYYTRPDRPGLWRQQAGGRFEPELVLPDLLPRDRYNWFLRGERVLWIMRTAGTALLLEHDLPTGRSVLVAEMPGCRDAGLAAAPGGDAFLYPRLGEAAGDLMLVTGWDEAR